MLRTAIARIARRQLNGLCIFVAERNLGYFKRYPFAERLGFRWLPGAPFGWSIIQCCNAIKLSTQSLRVCSSFTDAVQKFVWSKSVEGISGSVSIWCCHIGKALVMAYRPC